MFPSGTFRSPNHRPLLLLHAPRHSLFLSRRRIPLFIAATGLSSSSSAVINNNQGRSLCSASRPLCSSIAPSSSSTQFSVRRGSLVVSRSRTFSVSVTNMAGSKIDGTAIAKDIREKLKSEIAAIQAKNPRFRPNLVIYQGMSCFSAARPISPLYISL